MRTQRQGEKPKGMATRCRAAPRLGLGSRVPWAMPEPGAAGVMRQSAGITQRAGPCNDEELADCVSGSFKIHLEIRPVVRYAIFGA